MKAVPRAWWMWAAKLDTGAQATADGRIRMAPATLAAVRDGSGPKGDVLAAARIAGIMAAKKTGELHPAMPSARAGHASAWILRSKKLGIRVTARAALTGKTGVEMEALVAASTRLLTIYDMAKALEKGMVIEQVRLLEKTGGKSGDWQRMAPRSDAASLSASGGGAGAAAGLATPLGRRLCRSRRRRAAIWRKILWRAERSHPPIFPPWMAMRLLPAIWLGHGA